MAAISVLINRARKIVQHSATTRYADDTDSFLGWAAAAQRYIIAAAKDEAIPGLMKSLTGQTLTSGTASYALPADFVRLQQGGPAYPLPWARSIATNTNNWALVVPRGWQSLFDTNGYYKGTQTRPFATLADGKFYLSPTPNANGTYDLHYVRDGADFTATTIAVDLPDYLFDPMVFLMAEEAFIGDEKLDQAAYAHKKADSFIAIVNQRYAV